jgi:hypothetical protein
LNDDVSLIAGAHATVIAACQYYREVADRPEARPLVIFAAGRPPYLAGTNARLSEGQVLAEYFMRRARLIPSDIEILHNNRNTSDDVFNSAELAAERGVIDLLFVTVNVHVPRTGEFLRLAQPRFPQLNMHICASEEILRRRYAKSQRFDSLWEEVRTSKAYQRTAEREARGIDAVRSGRYWSQLKRNTDSILQTMT